VPGIEARLEASVAEALMEEGVPKRGALPDGGFWLVTEEETERGGGSCERNDLDMGWWDSKAPEGGRGAKGRST